MVEATSAAGAVVNLRPATATDASRRAYDHVLEGPPASTFGIGTTTVRVTAATDIVGNVTVETFTVTVATRRRR